MAQGADVSNGNKKIAAMSWQGVKLSYQLHFSG